MRSKGWKKDLKGRGLGCPQTARTLLLQLCIFGISLSSFAAPKSFKNANAAQAKGRYEEAINLYQEAIAEAPESGEIYFNLGNAQYRIGLYEEAMAAYEYAASMSQSDYTRGRSLYNIGNCMMKVGEAARPNDPPAAASYCEQAAWFYRMALDYDADFEDAAYNLEISQRMLAHIQEEILEQEEKEQQQNELMQYIREKLQAFVERQTQLLETQNTGNLQKRLEEETRELAEVMENSGLASEIPMPDGTSTPGPLTATFNHTIKAAEAMTVPDQQTALDELITALDSTPADPSQQEGESDDESDEYEDYDMEYDASDEEASMYEEADPFGDFSEYEEIRGVPPPNKTEMDILAEEIRNQERRKQKKAGEYKAVEKDW